MTQLLVKFANPTSFLNRQNFGTLKRCVAAFVAQTMYVAEIKRKLCTLYLTVFVLGDNQIQIDA